MEKTVISALHKAKVQSGIFKSALKTYNHIFNYNLRYVKVDTKVLTLFATSRL